MTKLPLETIYMTIEPLTQHNLLTAISQCFFFSSKTGICIFIGIWNTYLNRKHGGCLGGYEEVNRVGQLLANFDTVD